MPEAPVSPMTQAIEEEQIKPVPYTDKERIYLGNLHRRIQNARLQRDQKHPEFDGMDYLQYCESNRKGANTYVEPKKNKSDTNFQSGTIRQKLFTYLAALNALDLSPDVQAFDEQNHELAELGNSMEDIMFEVAQRDNDDEKKLLRQYTLLEQGTVFVEEAWEEKFRIRKNATGKFNGKLDSISWNPVLKKEYEGCTRNIKLNENVYLGDVRQFEMKKQPYIYTVEVRSYAETEAMYGTWERWEYVPKKIVKAVETADVNTLYAPKHYFETTQKDECEIIKYQDKWNDEYMVMINNVMMFRPGMPLSQVTPKGDYNIEKQVNEVISPFFAYGKSLVARMKNSTALLDEMLRLAVLKTQKSFAPPMFNNTGRVLSSRIFAPGTVTTGVDKDKIGPIDPSARAVEGGEYNMIDMLMRSIDRNSVDPTTSGNQPQGSPTATQILEVQRQAKMMIGLTVFVASLLEEKLAWLRLENILANWMEATGKEFNEYTGEWIVNYRSVNREKMISGAGVGRKIVKLAKDVPDSQAIMEEEQALSTPTRPVRVTYLSPEEIKNAKLMWYITVTPKEKKTDALNKVMFDEMMTKALANFPNANIQYFEERFADIWNENPAKMFTQTPPPAAPGAPTDGQQPTGPQPGLPQPKSIGQTGSMASLTSETLGKTSS
jgi:hypothetical protein